MKYSNYGMCYDLFVASKQLIYELAKRKITGQIITKALPASNNIIITRTRRIECVVLMKHRGKNDK